MRAKPARHCRLVELPGSDRQHRFHGLIRLDAKAVVIEGTEHRQRLPGEALVPIRERMVPRDANGKNRRLVDDSG